MGDDDQRNRKPMGSPLRNKAYSTTRPSHNDYPKAFPHTTRLPELMRIGVVGPTLTGQRSAVTLLIRTG